MHATLWQKRDRFGAPSQATRQRLLHPIDEIFNDLLDATPWQGTSSEFAPAYDVEERDSCFLLNFDLPGVDRHDINIEVQGTRLLVSGERKIANERRGPASQLGRHGKFQLVFTLPEGVGPDAVEANYKDGVLMVTVHKPVVARATKIKVGEGVGKHWSIKNLIPEKRAAKDGVEIKQDQAAQPN